MRAWTRAVAMMILGWALTLPAGAQTTTLTGFLNLVWEDPVDGSAPRLLAYVTADDQTVAIEYGEMLRPDLLRLNGQRVTITGSPSAAQPSSPPALQLQGIQGTDIAPGTPIGGSGSLSSGPLLSGPQPWITILCRFADTPNLTSAQPSFYAALMTGPGQTLDSYWREVSYNNITLAGSENKVVGWYNLPSPRSTYVFANSQDLELLAKDCSAAAEADVDFTAYVGINMVFNQAPSPNGNIYGGSTNLTHDGVTKNWRATWLFGAYPLGFLTHETGHAFGFPHSLGTKGETSEWDAMGSINPVHTISYHKDLNGWIPANRIVTVYGGSSVAVTLDVLTAPAPGALPMMVKIPIGSSLVHFYTVELRRRVGFDVTLPPSAFPPSGNAILIHDVLMGRPLPNGAHALVMDGDNNGNPNDAGANWTVGEVFSDTANGIRVEVTSETASSVTVVITNRSERPPPLYFGTLAGKQGTPGSADGTVDARFNFPTGVAVDGAGNVYVSDLLNYTIRKITPAGVVTTFAGRAGAPGLADGPGATARFSEVRGLAIDAAGTLYVGDGVRIRRISPLGVVSPFVQLPTSATELAVDAARTVYVASASSVIYKVTSAGVVTTLAGVANSIGTADGIGTAARFNGPTGIAVNSSGVVYVADSGNMTIRRISTSGAVTTLAGSPGVSDPMEDGTGAGFFSLPSGLAMLPDGSFYVADTFHHAIRRVTPAGVVTTVAGTWTTNAQGVDGDVEAARFGHLRDIAVDATGSIYTADSLNSTIRIGTRRTLLKASTAALRFGATRANGQFGSLTPSQEVTVTHEGSIPSWTAVADQPWVQITSGVGTGPGRFTVSVTDPGAGVTTATATVTLAAPALNTATTLSVVLTIQAPAGSPVPFGAFDTPGNNAAGLVGAIPVTGWALDNVGVTKVQVWRNCIETIDRPAGACASPAPGQPGNFVYIGDAAFLAGARPDVEVANLGIPLSYRAGWGYLMSTNALPHLPTQRGAGGQGTFTLTAYAIDVEGQFMLLGTKAIAIDNDNATIPFGVLDTPTQGGTITVSPFASFGWAMTQDPKCIDVAAPASWRVYIDGVSRPIVPNVNWFPGLTRPDIAAAYPGRCNTNNALAAWYIDATALGLSNGLHTTGWDVIDNQGNVAGIGSRFFNVLIGSSVTAGPSVTASVDADRPVALGHADALALLVPGGRTLRVQIGNDDVPFTTLPPGTSGKYAVQFSAGGRLALDFGSPVNAGYQIVGRELRELPAGSTLDGAAGTFAWQPPVPFLGPFTLVFIGDHTRTDVVATIVDRTSQAGITMHIDTPASDAAVGGPFVIAGWALDPLASTGTGIDTLHVWAYRRDGVAAPQFLGAAAVGGARSDVAAIYGEQFDRAGFTLTTSALAPGVYDLVVYPWSHRTGRFEAATIVRLSVR